MVMSFFGKKQGNGANAGDAARPDKNDKGDMTTTLGFTQLGDVGRGLAAAAGKIQVSEAQHEDNAAVEEAAILYANASEDGARAILEATIDGADGKAGDFLWRMLLDLLRLMGDKAAFDARSEVFARQFEISPPMWDQDEAVAATEKRDAAPAVNLSGNLSGSARTQFEQLVRIGAKTGKLRVDFSRLRGIDEEGVTLLADTFAGLKKSKVKLALLGGAHAYGLLEARLKVGEKENRPCWALALELLQHMGDQDRFEQVAVDFAITFEESPPSWEPPEQVNLTETGGLTESKPSLMPPTDRFVFEGVIAGSQPEEFRKLAAYASQRQLVDIDANKLRRMEFVAAGSLFNLVAQFQAQGKLAVIHGPNALVEALLKVMGIDQIAQIERRKS